MLFYNFVVKEEIKNIFLLKLAKSENDRKSSFRPRHSSSHNKVRFNANNKNQNRIAIATYFFNSIRPVISLGTYLC